MSEDYSLPQAFQEQIRAQLGPEADDYFAALERPYVRGLRLTPRKPLENPAALIEGLGKPVPWQPGTGRYLSQESTAGAQPLHEAGAYYIQEPSAMAAVAVLDPRPGERVLDLCAAPGGKSTQIADALDGRGLLVSNEPVPGRAKILSRNLERMGVVNGLAVSAEPEQLAPRWAGFFDAILVDAPCSGEGMFRRHSETREEWTEQSPSGCAARQRRILTSAWAMLRPGGRLTYSTCTLNRVENEGVIQWMQETFSDCEPVAFSLPAGEGRTLDASGGMLHLYPHQVEGEGHFVALLHKRGAEPPAPALTPGEALAKPDKQLLQAYETFAWDTGASLPPANARLGDALLSAPSLPPLQGIRVLRAGLRLGALKGKVFQPDHALALALDASSGFPSVSVSLAEARAYLRGEVLPCPDALSGFFLLLYESLPLGFAKASNAQLKNHYPKALRKG